MFKGVRLAVLEFQSYLKRTDFTILTKADNLLKKAQRIMHIFNFFGFLGLLLLIGCQQTPDFNEISVPTFDQCPAKVCKPSLEKEVDLSSHPEGKLYRTVLKNGYAQGPNFANCMTVVTNGCGTNCQYNWIIDGRTGKIIDRLESETAFFKKDSSLLILNPTSREQQENHSRGEIRNNIITKFLQWDGISLKLIMDINSADLLDKNIVINNE